MDGWTDARPEYRRLRGTGALIRLSAIALLACGPARQPAPAAAPLDWNAGDSANLAWLDAHGRRMAGRTVVVLAPPEEMPESWQAALLDSLDRGVAELRRLVGSPAWQRLGDQPIRYYLVSERMVSHASGNGVVFISMFHVRSGDAPYLHEAGHELLAQRAASAAKTVEGDVFAIGSLEQTDSTCAARLAVNPYRADLLRTLGGKGAVDALFTTDRSKVAPAFYACARSMAKFLVELIGTERAVALFPAIKSGDWPAALERAAGMPPAAVRSRWRARLGMGG